MAGDSEPMIVVERVDYLNADVHQISNEEIQDEAIFTDAVRTVESSNYADREPVHDGGEGDTAGSDASLLLESSAASINQEPLTAVTGLGYDGFLADDSIKRNPSYDSTQGVNYGRELTDAADDVDDVEFQTRSIADLNHLMNESNPSDEFLEGVGSLEEDAVISLTEGTVDSLMGVTVDSLQKDTPNSPQTVDFAIVFPPVKTDDPSSLVTATTSHLNSQLLQDEASHVVLGTPTWPYRDVNHVDDDAPLHPQTPGSSPS